MLKLLEATPKPFGDKLCFGKPLREIADDVIEHGAVYCVKNCFDGSSIDDLKKKIWKYFLGLPETRKNYGGPPLAANYHTIERGVSSSQKTLHYFHAFVFDAIGGLPLQLELPITGLYYSITTLYNDLTGNNRSLSGIHSDGKSFHKSIFQYPVGGGMFAAHTHPLEPIKLSIILGFSKRGRDFQDGASGFEAPDGSIIDTSSVHDMGDILIFRANLKHWSTPCDIKQPLDVTLSSGRWVAVLGIY